MKVLECLSLTKNYGRLCAVDRLNFSVGKGRIVGLLGTNGSGKTTLMKMVAGLLTPTTGQILICGKSPCAETKAMVSYLPDTDYLPGYMKVRQLIRMFKDFYKDFDADRAEQMMSRLGIGAELRLRTLSKGTREKVGLVLTMSRRAKLYLLDEPIGGVDPAARDYIIETIINNYDRESSVIISTHLISDVENVLDDFLFIDKGRIIECGCVETVREEKGKTVDELFREVFRC